MWSPFPRGEEHRKRLGLIVNPIAGIGGKVGLKGSDGAQIQKRAWELGAVPQAEMRAKKTFQLLTSAAEGCEVITPPGEMGEKVALSTGFNPLVVGGIIAGNTSPEDTRRAAQAMLESEVDLLLFAGGDGTAVDICEALGTQLPVLGIPAGVKVHSAVFATHPTAAGELAAAYLNSRSIKVREAEVVDLDEDAYRAGKVTTQLHGYLMVPHHRRWRQNSKVPTPAADEAQMEAIAHDVREQMEPGCLYILGPGTTTRAVAQQLGVEKTLVGVDVVTNEGELALDVNERRILELIDNRRAKIILTPIGGQGFLFGRGNQPISPEVIRAVGVANIQVISTAEKLFALEGRPLLVDTGDANLDQELGGYVSITTGYRESIVYRIAA